MNLAVYARGVMNGFNGVLRQGRLRCIQTSPALMAQENSSQSEEKAGTEEKQEDEFSFTEGAEEDGEEQLRREILDAALPFVHSLGWSQDALAQGAESLGYSSMAHGMFPNGAVELVNHFYASCNQRLRGMLEEEVNRVKEQPELKKGTTAFIGSAVEERLRMNVEYIDSWHRALALHASPLNARTALENLGTLVDNIWHYAGDRSTDFNWYTKRGILAAVYKSTEIYLLQDTSEDFQETWAFMNRRLSNVHNIANCARSSQKFAESFCETSKAGLFTALNILGMNGRTR